ncbi:MAG: hypothetical protein ACPF9D_02410 [Owenweeksia sp.]
MKNLYVSGVLSFLMVYTTHSLQAQCTYDASNPLIISTNTSWNGTQQINSDVEINSGATLTVYGTVEMLQQGKVLIKAGGKLIINGGHITKNAACSSSWKGVEMEGNSSLGQTQTNQPYLEIRNSGKISHACRGVLNTTYSSSGGFNWQQTGGIISAEDAIFENNTRDLTFLTYHSMNGSGEPDYAASFTNCDFLRDDNYTSSSALLSHVALLDVAGVSFAGCEFINDHSPDPTEDRTAIGATNAVFYVTASPQRNSRFEKYDRGIFASGGGRADKEIEISQTDFFANEIGAHLIACSNVKIVYNSFAITRGLLWEPGTGIVGPRHYGVFLDNTYDFSIAGNYFNNISPTQHLIGQTAIGVNEGDGFTNRIYKNSIDQLSGGLELLNHNRNASATDGLLVQCNDFDLFPDVDVDVIVRPSNLTNAGATAEMGIAKHQGPFNTNQNDYSKMANNLFNLDNNKQWFTSLSCNESFYYYSSQEPRCLPASVSDSNIARLLNYHPQVVNFNYATLCPDPPLSIEPGDQATTQGGLMGEDQDWGDEWELLVQLVDNGSTPALEAQILASHQPDYQDLYLDLMEMSPYVSVDNLLNLLSLGDFPELAIRNILVANPHGARDPEVMEAVYEHVPAFAASTIADIESGSHTVTSYDVQTGKIAGHNYERHALADLLMASYGEEEDALDRLAQLLEDRPEVVYHYELVDMELQAGRLQEAQDHLDAMANTALWEGSTGDRHQAMLEYYAVVTGCLEDNRPLTQLNSEEIEDLQAMATYNGNEFGLVRNKAISLLWLNEMEAVYHLPEAAEDPQGKRAWTDRPRPAEPLARVEAYPNPATDYLIVRWDWLQLGLTGALEVELYDMKGGLMLTRRVEDYARNTLLLRLQDQRPGSCILRLKSAGKVLYSEGLLIH